MFHPFAAIICPSFIALQLPPSYKMSLQPIAPPLDASSSDYVQDSQGTSDVEVSKFTCLPLLQTKGLENRENPTLSSCPTKPVFLRKFRLGITSQDLNIKHNTQYLWSCKFTLVMCSNAAVSSQLQGVIRYAGSI